MAKAMTELTIHSDEIAKHIRSTYSSADLDRLEAFLFERGVIAFRSLKTGLFPAAEVDAATSRSGYHNVWVRDNVFVAHAHYVNGRLDTAVGIARGLAAFFSRRLARFDGVIAGTVGRNLPMNRPHIRFDGATLSELPEKWSHAQNDALGYVVWLFSNLAAAGAIARTADGLALLERFAAYFRAIRFWEDEDSGHWEEKRKISASSIGVVVAGLEAMKALFEARRHSAGFGSNGIDADVRLLSDTIARGRQALKAILPFECVQSDKGKRRRFDAALLFLAYPVDVVAQPMADQIVADVAKHLQGDVGIRRYLGDSYWRPDYRELYPPDERSGDFSDDLERRGRFLKEGEEAQWCIFDPIVSAIYGRRYLLSGSAFDLEKQVAYFNRSLGQITRALQCPEAYFLEWGEYVPNDNTPLLWTRANLWAALKVMKDAAALRAG
jgi:phosphorylase kinase alpha/beta subunit